MRNSNFAVVIPVRNEQDSIASVIGELKLEFPKVTIIVVNDFSTDGTREVLQKEDVILLNNMLGMGAWQSIQTGLLLAYDMGFTNVVTMDGDGQHVASEIKYLFNNDLNDSDLVVGRCKNRVSTSQIIAWKLFKFIGQVNIVDVTSGFRLYKKSALAILTTEQAALLEYQDVGVLLFMKSAGLKCLETDVRMRRRTSGKSRIFSSWSKIIYYMVTTLMISFSKTTPESTGEFFKRLQ